MFRTFLLTILVSMMSANLFAAEDIPQSFTLDGRLFDSATPTDPLLDSGTIVIQILNPAQTCILYEESQSFDTQTSDGYFHIRVGSATGDAKRGSADRNNAMTTVFSNTSSTNINGKLATDGVTNCSYNASAGDLRRLRIKITGQDLITKTLSPDMYMDSVPNAMVAESAETLQGLSRSQVLELGAGSLTQANVENVFSVSNYSTLTDLLSGTSTDYVRIDSNGASLPGLAADPATPAVGQIWYDTTLNQIRYKDNTLTIKSLGTGSGSVTSVTAGTGLTGGTITTTGTIALDTVGTAGTYTKVTTDAYGRVSSGTTLAESDIPTLSTAGKVSGSAINTGTIGGNTVISTTGAIGTSSSVSARVFDVYDSDNSNFVRLQTPATGVLTSDYTLTLPADAGLSGQYLTTNGSGTLSWSVPPSCLSTEKLQMSAGPIYTWSCISDADSGGDITGVTTNAGSGLSGGAATGTPVLQVEVDGATIEINGTNDLQVKDLGIATDKLAAGAVTNAKVTDVAVGKITSSAGTDYFTYTPAGAECVDGQVLKWTAANRWECANDTDTDTGEANTASNVTGTTGVGVFKQKTGVDLEFKSLLPGSNKLSISGGASDVTLDVVTANIDHDALSNFVANEHVDHSSVSITSGAGLTGGGDLTATRTLEVGAGAGIAVNADDVAVDITGTTAETTPASGDEILVYDTSATALRKMTRANFLTGYLQAAIGTSAGDVMSASAVPNCTSTQKLEMSAGPTYTWSCVSEAVTSVFGRTGAVTATSGDYTATQITNTAAGNIAAVTAQNALNELDTEKVAKAGDTMTGNLTMDNQREVRFVESGSTNYMAIRAPSTLGGDFTLTLPENDGDNGQVLTTDGSGVLTWTTPGSAGEANTASNVTGSTGVGVFKQKTGVDLEFKSLLPGSNKLSISGGASDVTLDVVPANIDHDALSNFVANEHVDHSSVSITSGAGLTGGGDLTATRTLAVGAGAGITVNADDVAVNITGTTAETTPASGDEILVYDTSATALRKMTRSNFLTGYLQAAIGTSAGDVMSASAVPNCTSTQKLEMSAGPTYTWSCVSEAVGTSVADADNDTKIQVEESADEDKIRFDTAGSERMIIDNSGNVGIGTTAPGQALQVVGQNAEVVSTATTNSGYFATNYSTSGFPRYYASKARGTASAPTAVQANDWLGDFGAQGYDGSLWYYVAGTAMKADESFTGSAHGASLLFYTTNTGSIGSSEKMRITGNGSVGIGTTSPSSKLQVSGVITNVVQSFTGAFTCGTSAIDFSTSNFQRLTPSGVIAAGTCNVTLSNLVAGGSYTLVTTGNAAINAVTYNFTGYTFKYMPANVATTSAKDSIYTFLYDGTTVYVTWSGGY